MLSEASAAGTTVPEIVVPLAGDVTATVGEVGSAGSTTFEKCTGTASVAPILLWSARTSHPFSVCEPTWTPGSAYVPSSERSILTGSLSTWKWT